MLSLPRFSGLILPCICPGDAGEILGRFPERGSELLPEEAEVLPPSGLPWGEVLFAAPAGLEAGLDGPVFFPVLPAGFSFKEFKIGLQSYAFFANFALFFRCPLFISVWVFTPINKYALKSVDTNFSFVAILILCFVCLLPNLCKLIVVLAWR